MNEVDFPGSAFFGGKVPTILELQNYIEKAWDLGINVQGRIETGGIRGTRKYIGTPEVGYYPLPIFEQELKEMQAQAIFCSVGVPYVLSTPRYSRLSPLTVPVASVKLSRPRKPGSPWLFYWSPSRATSSLNRSLSPTQGSDRQRDHPYISNVLVGRVLVLAQILTMSQLC